jgi:cytochrome c oxidase cbb3-type subunit III
VHGGFRSQVPEIAQAGDGTEDRRSSGEEDGFHPRIYYPLMVRCRFLPILTLALATQLGRAQNLVDTGRELYRANCYVCHGQDGDQVPGVNFRVGIRRASTDEDVSKIIAGGIPGTGMPPTNMAEPQRRALVAYLRSMHPSATASKLPGDAARGMAIFEGKGGCTACHRAGGQGSRFGPDLDGIGATKQAAYLEDEMLDPSHAIAPQNRLVTVVMKNGTEITGRRLNEDTQTIQLIDKNERLISVEKSELQRYTLLKSTPMPSYRDKLNEQEIADVVSYLLSLRGQ